MFAYDIVKADSLIVPNAFVARQIDWPSLGFVGFSHVNTPFLDRLLPVLRLPYRNTHNIVACERQAALTFYHNPGNTIPRSCYTPVN